MMMNSRETLSNVAQDAIIAHRPHILNNVETWSNDENEFIIDDLKDSINGSIQRDRSSLIDANDCLPDNIFIRIFSYLTVPELMRCSRVCRRWYFLISRNSHLWRRLYLRSDPNCVHSGAVHVRHLDGFLHALANRFQSALLYIDLPTEMITTEILRELANRCPNLEYLTLDFSSAMQLHDFNDLQEFPCNLKRLCICLSEVIFLESFMRRIYGFLSSLNILHVVGTLERTSNSSVEETDEYETINISRLKMNAPNLRVINFYGICFLDDSHIEAIASACIHLECLALNFCVKFIGTSLKNLTNRCRKLKCLLLQNTGIRDEPIFDVDWSTTQLIELDLTSTDLSENALLALFSTIPRLNFLSVAFCDGFTDKVLNVLIERGTLNNGRGLDLSHTVNLSSDIVHRFLTTLTPISKHLQAFNFTGRQGITEQFWIRVVKDFHFIKVLIIGTAHSWFKHMARRIHIDQILEACAVHCPKLERLEIQWDPETLRYSENSSKFIDHLRLRCTRLKSFVLSDGAYYEGAKANFERAERFGVVRTLTMYRTSVISALSFYNELRFN